MIKARKEYRRIRDLFKVMPILARGYLARKLYAKDLEEAKERARRLEEIKKREADKAERAKLEATEKEIQKIRRLLTIFHSVCKLNHIMP